MAEGTQLNDRKVYVELSGLGRGKVIVDGHDISRFVSELRVNAEVGDLTTVTVTLLAPELRAMLDQSDVVILEHLLDADEAIEVEAADLTLVGD